MSLDKIIEQARELALSEIKSFGTPKIEHFELSCEVGQRLVVSLSADKDIVMLGTILMDLKLGQCLKENRLSDHIKESVKETEKFLSQFDLDKEIVAKIINCVAAHHGTEKYNSLEAEICANADCYRFLTPRGIMGYLVMLGTRDQNIDMCFDQVLTKMEEKYKILSLKICQEELSDYYQQFKKLITEARTK